MHFDNDEQLPDGITGVIRSAKKSMGASASVINIGVELACTRDEAFGEEALKSMTGECFSQLTFDRLKNTDGVVSRDQVQEELRLALDPAYTPEAAAASATQRGGAEADEMLREFCGKKKALNAGDESGAKSLREVTSLVDRGANPNARDDMGWTPLMYASADGLHALAVYLCDEASAVLDATDDVGCTALWNAAYNGQRATSLLLMGRGADTAIKGTEEGFPPCTAVQAARRNGNPGLADLIEAEVRLRGRDTTRRERLLSKELGDDDFRETLRAEDRAARAEMAEAAQNAINEAAAAQQQEKERKQGKSGHHDHDGTAAAAAAAAATEN